MCKSIKSMREEEMMQGLQRDAFSACCYDLRGTFCHHSQFFSSQDAAVTWQTTHPDALVLGLQEAYQVAQLIVAYQAANGA